MSQDFSDFADLDLAENSDPRCPVVLVLDSSSSMNELLPGEQETAMAALNSGLDVLVSELNKDPLARRRVEISFVVFGTEVSPATAFSTVDKLVLPTLVPSGITSTGPALEEALRVIEERKKDYKKSGIEYFRPWIMLISDGLPTSETATAAKKIRAAEEAGRLSFFAVGVEGADMERLAEFSEKREPLKLQGVKFGELFVWLSASQSAVSASQPGDAVKLPSPEGWMEI